MNQFAPIVVGLDWFGDLNPWPKPPCSYHHVGKLNIATDLRCFFEIPEKTKEAPLEDWASRDSRKGARDVPFHFCCLRVGSEAMVIPKLKSITQPRSKRQKVRVRANGPWANPPEIDLVEFRACPTRPVPHTHTHTNRPQRKQNKWIEFRAICLERQTPTYLFVAGFERTPTGNKPQISFMLIAFYVKRGENTVYIKLFK